MRYLLRCILLGLDRVSLLPPSRGYYVPVHSILYRSGPISHPDPKAHPYSNPVSAILKIHNFVICCPFSIDPFDQTKGDSWYLNRNSKPLQPSWHIVPYHLIANAGSIVTSIARALHPSPISLWNFHRIQLSQLLHLSPRTPQRTIRILLWTRQRAGNFLHKGPYSASPLGRGRFFVDGPGRWRIEVQVFRTRLGPGGV